MQNGCGITMRDGDGKPRAIILQHKDGSRIMLKDADGKKRVLSPRTKLKTDIHPLKSMQLPRLLIPLLSFDFETGRKFPIALPAQSGERTPAKLRVVAYNVACGQWAIPERIAKELRILSRISFCLVKSPRRTAEKRSRIGLAVWPMRSAWIMSMSAPCHPRVTSLITLKLQGDPTGNYGGN